MPFNLIKQYPELLELAHLGEKDRMVSLQRIFDRDIANNERFAFAGKRIRPIKKDGEPPMQVLFHHLTTREDKDDKGRPQGGRSFEMQRSMRLHWIRHHIEGRKQNGGVEVFSFLDRDKRQRKDVIRTYLYDIEQEYVIILEPQRSGEDYYLLTAYHLNEPGGKKQIENKWKKRMPDVY